MELKGGKKNLFPKADSALMLNIRVSLGTLFHHLDPTHEASDHLWSLWTLVVVLCLVGAVSHSGVLAKPANFGNSC